MPLRFAQHPRRMVHIGSAARAITLFGNVFPKIGDWVGEEFMFAAQKTGPTPQARWEGQLYEGEPDEEPRREGELSRYVMRSSMYTQAKLHPFRTLGMALLGMGAAWAIARSLSRA